MRVASAVARFLVAALLVSSVFGTESHAQQAGVPPPPPLPAPAGEPIPTGNGFILGQVVDFGTGEPIPNAVVTLTSYGALPGSAPGTAAAMIAVTSVDLTPSKPQLELTNANGYFFYGGISGGRYGMSVIAVSYLVGGYLQTKPDGTRHFIDLAQDEKKGDIKIRLWKEGSISGTVLDEAGEPAVGAVVKAISRVAANGRLRFAQSGTATTDDRGVYRLSGVTPGEYVVGLFNTASTVPTITADLWSENLAAPSPAGQALMASAMASGLRPASESGIRIDDLSLQTTTMAYSPPAMSGGKLLVYSTTFFPGVTNLAQARTIKIVSGEERTGVDLSLKLVAASKVSGTVTDSAGPSANIGVKLLPASVDEFLNENGVETATSLTDTNGAFTFLGVPEGSYTLKVLRTFRQQPLLFNAPGAPAAPAPIAPASTQTLWASQGVTVGATDLTGVSVVLRGGFHVAGRIEFAGSIAKPTDDVLMRATIALTPLETSAPAPPGPTQVTSDGQFTSGNYPPGKYLVRASMPAQGWTLRSAMQGTRDLADEPLDLTGDLGGLVLTFADKTAQISGSVVDAKGAPDPLADIIVFPADSDAWRQNAAGTRRIRLMSATKYGTYALTGLPPGKYYAVAVDSSQTDNWQESKFLERLLPLATPVTVGEGENKSQLLKTTVLR